MMGEPRLEVLEPLTPLDTRGEAEGEKSVDQAEDRETAQPPFVMPRREYFDWRKFDPAIHLPEGTPMAEELATYGKHLAELIHHEGQYVLIKGDELCGIFLTLRAALDEAADRFGGEMAMVKEIAYLEPIEEIGHALP